MNSAKVSIICIILSLVFLAYSATSQEPVRDCGPSQWLDSLLLSGSVEHFLSLMDGQMDSGLVDQYEPLSSKLRELSRASGQDMAERCRELDSAAVNLQRRKSGPQATRLFDRLDSALQIHSWREVLASYFIALHFRNHQIQNEKQRLRTQLRWASDLGREGRYEESLQAVAAFRAEDPDAPAYRVLRDSLVEGYDRLEGSSKLGLAGLNRERNSQVITKRLAITAGLGVSSFPALPRGFAVLKSSEVPFSTEPIDAKVNPVFAMRVDYQLTPAISLGAQSFGGRICNEEVFVEPFGTPDPARVHFNQQYIAITVGTKVYFREKTGVRPFAGMSAGLLWIHRSASDMRSAKWEARGVHASLEEERKYYRVIVLDVGCEYEPAADSPVFFGLSLGVISHMGDVVLLNRFIGNIIAHCGVNVL